LPKENKKLQQKFHDSLHFLYFQLKKNYSASFTKMKLFIFFFFFSSLSPFTLLGLSGTFTVGLFFPIFSCGAAGLRGTFPGYPRPPSLFSFFWTTQHEYNTQHPWEAHPTWDSNPADLAVVSEECRSSFHHPTVSP
jgi:hypothetical protein